ncbi:uncharacterized protein HMPREF1541_05514 [Cyphellophora europaea CBS 101466]|uniref:Ataxin-10 homolog n=1 Tax=Cyphellophora europaea (strain CBS 101466) TaxID=1220924 RepID=W2RRZ5_CYPE1|nr:uncharacterized protein HMPREF1541_05514 [Cyphellophora europaea CBS 101466]ETN39291.1 hypothetical protein HMPREF1541_05514 [Cyphellophora europaea CBS 101466]
MTPAECLLNLVLSGTQSHYEFRGVIDDKRLEHLLLAGKQILYKSHQESDTRQALGFSPKVWTGLSNVLAHAIPVLESLSFAWKTGNAGTHAANGGNYNGSSSDLIAANYLGLVKDIERLNDLCTIARNLLATTKRAQNLAAEMGFDQQILRLIDVCVRVTARGFDGEGGNVRSEERWGKVVNLYKRLLITCLQFLHNFIMHNEQRKLVLWLDLFGNAASQPPQQQQQQQQQPQTLNQDLTETKETEAPKDQAPLRAEEAAVQERIKSAMEKLPQGAEGGLGYNIEDVHALFEMMSATKQPDANTQETAKVLMEKIRSDMERLSGLNSNQLDGNPEALLKVGAALRAQMPNKDLSPPIEQAARNASVETQRTNGRQWNSMPDFSSYADITGASQEITTADLQMPRTSQSAAETLQEAKDELMARLQEPQSHASDDAPYDDEDGTAASHVLEDSLLDSAEEDLSESEHDSVSNASVSETSSYRHPNDQERGLLTDVPLVLGPTEIEALPMIIQAGIVDNFGNSSNKPLPPQTAAERQNIRNMQSVRCHILLAQEAGRNVLRELLIFIAAWDLPDDEFYFKMMVQIMEAILKNGLMSHAYADFGQAKDIISPAQAVVVKILTHIYRTRYSPASAQNQKDADRSAPREAIDASRSRVPAPLTRVDVLTVRYIFTVFRGNIVPETCALIYLQGQIRHGLALAEDFPLNLWDMERVYEGVYQFLEFFAVLTENNDWKRLLVEWEIVYDLCTLIKELEAAIPKVNPLTAAGKAAVARDGDRDVGVVYQGEAAEMAPPPSNQLGDADTSLAPTQTSSAAPVAVERPYSLSPPPSPPIPLPLDPAINSPPPSLPPNAAAPHPPSTNPPLEDPSTFEWRNLKKLIILVLSSLVWKSRLVQDQIRAHRGVDTVLACTVHDANNPYIREHAVMCLKFLLEGNEENQALVAQLESQGVADAYDEGEGGFQGGSFGGGFGATGAAGMGKGKRRAASESAAEAAAVGLGPVEARRLRERFGELSFGESERASGSTVGGHAHELQGDDSDDARIEELD